MKEIIEKALSFIESEEMREHLQSEIAVLSTYHVTTLIAGSRASLEDKIAALRFVSEKLAEIESDIGGIFERDEAEQKAIDELDRLIKAGEFALNEITENIPVGTVFLLSSYLFDGLHEATENFDISVPFATFKAAKNRLITEANTHYEYNEDHKGYKRYTISKWILLEDGEMQNIVTWHLSDEGVIWFADINERIDEQLKQLSEDCDYLSSNYFNELGWLTVPYKAGDIVTIDCSPTNEISYAVISEIIDDGSDCCGIQAIHKHIKRSGFRQSALKHDFHIAPLFTCMYRLKKYTGELPPGYGWLKGISEELKENPLVVNEKEWEERFLCKRERK
jgi:hypothetical protein